MKITIPEQMKVIELLKPGGPEVLALGSRPVPAIKNDEVLVQVKAAGVNGPDIAQRKGLYPPPQDASDLLGLEVTGEIIAVGSEVHRWSVGDQVCALTKGGGYAEYCPVQACHCLPVPKKLSYIEAAGIPESFFTVWSNVFIGNCLKEGDVFLVHGGAGGIGSTAIQLGKAFGAKIYTTDSPAYRCEECARIGADRVIDYSKEDFVEIVTSETDGADIIVDIVGGTNIERNFAAAALDCRIIQLAFNKGSKVEIDLRPIQRKRLVLTGSTLRPRTDSFKAMIARELEEKVWPKIEKGEITPKIFKVFSLDQAAEAHKLMESATHFGKIILKL